MGIRTGLPQNSSSFKNFLSFLGRPFFWAFFYLLVIILGIFGFLRFLLLFLIRGLLAIYKSGAGSLPFLVSFLRPLTSELSKFFFYLLETFSRKAKPIKVIFPVPRPKVTKRWVFLVLALFLTGLGGAFFYSAILKDLPHPDKLITREQVVTTKIYDREGRLLYKIYRNQNRTLVKLEDVPLSLRQATIAIEDAEFYHHPGFSLKGILRATSKFIRQGRLEGGSTITQQLVKNALLTPERTLRRKIKEVILAFQVERRFSKDEILQMYLNEVGYGGAAYGIEEASQLYFGKPVKELSLPEAALLAGLPASPTTYSPFGAHPEMAKARQDQVLRRMAQEGYITPKQAEETLAADLHLAPQKTDILAPHFVMYVRQILVDKYGEKMVEEGGLEVITSLDLELQEKTQEIVRKEVEGLKRLRITNGAALVTNPATGEILSMVGSKDYFDTSGEGNFNVTTASRQPGSSIKPVNYSAAFELGFTPATILSDTPITYRLPGQPPYSPKNYDNRFHGNIPLRVAFASSYNVPAVKVLSAIGVSRMIEQGEKLGITTWNDPSRFGLSLTLGGGEVKMIDMAVLYGALANQGFKVPLDPILEVKNYKGETLTDEDKNKEEEKVLSEQIAYIITDILTDNGARTPAFGPNSVLNIPDKKVAVKTGTSNNLKDNWTIGYTPNFVVVTWVGNNDASSMSYVASGITGASPIWRKITDYLLANYPYEEFREPEGLIKVEICSLTGTLSCSACPSKRIEIFLPGTQPQYTCRDEEIRKIFEKEREEPKLSSSLPQKQSEKPRGSPPWFLFAKHF